MRIDYTFPALVVGVPPHCRRPRETFCYLEGAVDVPEVSAADAPLACEISWYGLLDTYRWRDGKFYLKVGDPTRYHLQASRAEAVPSIGDAVLLHMSRLLRADPARQALVWPRRAGYLVDALQDHRSNLREAAVDCAEIARERVAVALEEMADVDAASAVAWREVATGLASGMFRCAGGLWMEADEPVLFVDYRIGGAVNLETLAAFVTPRNGASVGTVTRWRKAVELTGSMVETEEMVAYGLTELDALRNDLERAAEGEPRLAHALQLLEVLSGITVFTPEVFGTVLPALDIDRVARAVWIIGHELFFDTRPGRPVRGTPDAAVAAWQALDAVLRIAVPEDVAVIEPALSDFMDRVCEAYASARPMRLASEGGVLIDPESRPASGDGPIGNTTIDLNAAPRELFATVSARVSTAIERWNARPIEIEPHPGRPSP